MIDTPKSLTQMTEEQYDALGYEEFYALLDQAARDDPQWRTIQERLDQEVSPMMVPDYVTFVRFSHERTYARFAPSSPSASHIPSTEFIDIEISQLKQFNLPDSIIYHLDAGHTGEADHPSRDGWGDSLMPAFLHTFGYGHLRIKNFSLDQSMTNDQRLQAIRQEIYENRMSLEHNYSDCRRYLPELEKVVAFIAQKMGVSYKTLPPDQVPQYNLAIPVSQLAKIKQGGTIWGVDTKDKGIFEVYLDAQAVENLLTANGFKPDQLSADSHEIAYLKISRDSFGAVQGVPTISRADGPLPKPMLKLESKKGGITLTDYQSHLSDSEPPPTWLMHLEEAQEALFVLGMLIAPIASRGQASNTLIGQMNRRYAATVDPRILGKEVFLDKETSVIIPKATTSTGARFSHSVPKEIKVWDHLAVNADTPPAPKTGGPLKVTLPATAVPMAVVAPALSRPGNPNGSSSLTAPVSSATPGKTTPDMLAAPGDPPPKEPTAAADTDLALRPVVTATAQELQTELRALVVQTFSGVSTRDSPFAQTEEHWRTIGVDANTGHLVTESKPGTDQIIEVRILVVAQGNRVLLDPRLRAELEAGLPQMETPLRDIASNILSLDSMPIVPQSEAGSPRVGLLEDGGRAESEVISTSPELTSANKAKLPGLARSNQPVTIMINYADRAMGMGHAVIVRLYFAPDGTITGGDMRMVNTARGTVYHGGIGNSPNYVDVVVMGRNTLVAYNDLSHLSPRQVAAFLSLYNDPEITQARHLEETEHPYLAQMAMGTGVGPLANSLNAVFNMALHHYIGESKSTPTVLEIPLYRTPDGLKTYVPSYSDFYDQAITDCPLVGRVRMTFNPTGQDRLRRRPPIMEYEWMWETDLSPTDVESIDRFLAWSQSEIFGRASTDPVDGIPALEIYPLFGDKAIAMVSGSGELVIGRDPGSNLVLNSQQVSRRQAVIRREGDHWVITNEGKNPIFINGQAIPKGASRRLALRDNLKIGDMPYQIDERRIAKVPGTSPENPHILLAKAQALIASWQENPANYTLENIYAAREALVRARQGFEAAGDITNVGVVNALLAKSPFSSQGGATGDKAGDPPPKEPVKPASKSPEYPLVTAEGGREIARDIFGNDFEDILARVEGWDAQQGERFWQQVGVIQAESFELARGDPKAIILRLMDKVDSFYTPLGRGVAFMRLNGTPQEAYEFHQAHPRPYDYREFPSTTETFIDQNGRPKTYRVPRYVMEKLDAWILGHSNEMTTEIKGNFTVETLSDGILLITDFIPRASYTRSIKGFDEGLWDIDPLGTMESVLLTPPPFDDSAKFLYAVMGIDFDPKYKIPIPDGTLTMPVHSHPQMNLFPGGELRSPDKPSDADFNGGSGLIQAVRTPNAGLILYLGNSSRQSKVIVAGKVDQKVPNGTDPVPPVSSTRPEDWDDKTDGDLSNTGIKRKDKGKSDAPSFDVQRWIMNESSLPNVVDEVSRQSGGFTIFFVKLEEGSLLFEPASYPDVIRRSDTLHVQRKGNLWRWYEWGTKEQKWLAIADERVIALIRGEEIVGGIAPDPNGADPPPEKPAKSANLARK